MSVQSLELFGVVPDKKYMGKNFGLNRQYGVLVSPAAVYDIVNIQLYLEKTAVGFNEMNSSFWGSWRKIQQMSEFQMFCDQILHYFSTYGMEYFYGIDSVKNGLVYVPNEVLNLQTPVTLRLIDAESPAKIIERCFSLLKSGIALTQDTIQKILYVLAECDYEITGEEEIANKEAQVLFYEASGKLPKKSDELFRYLIYYFSGSTMVVNDKKTREMIMASHKKLPVLDFAQMIALAESFNRHRDLWMAIKKADFRNAPVVNRLTKLSKEYHVHLPENIMNELTSKKYALKAVEFAAKRASTFVLIRAYNALALRMTKPDTSSFRIRNGKMWTKLEKPTDNLGVMDMHEYQAVLLQELRGRFSKVKIYKEAFVDYPLITSEKNFVGNIPEGTILRFPKTSENLLVGVHWKDEYTDLDLRAESSSFSLGWNTRLKNTWSTIMHSGDMTRAPKPYGASEWVYFSELPATFNLKLNVYSGTGFSRKFKFIVGHSQKSKVEKGYIISPEEVIFSCMIPMEENQLDIGMVYSEKDFNCIYIGIASTGTGRVGRYTKYDEARQESLRRKLMTSLRLADVVEVVDSPEKATVDLSIGNLSKDSFLSILK